MILKMIFITVLILAILFATFVKDGDKMNPPLKRRAVIDLTVIGSLWLLFAIFYLSHDPGTDAIATNVINIALLYFVGQLVYLIASISDLFNGLVKTLKKDGVELPKDDDKKGE